MKTKASLHIPDPDNEKGLSMVIAMIVVFMLSVLAVSLMATVRYTIHTAGDELTKVKAFYLAEAGIARAKRVLKDSSFTEVLVGADGLPNTSDDGILSFGPSVSLGSGTYNVRVADNDDGDDDALKDADYKVRITSSGVSQDVKRRIRTLVTSLVSSKHAIISGGDLTIGGNAPIQGSNGSIHANADLSINGNPVIAGNATASGSYWEVGGPTIGGKSGGGFPLEYIPPVDPQKYRPTADYELMSDGDVYDSAGNHVGSEDFNGWTWTSGNNWTCSDEASAYNGTYYIEGDATISGKVGTPESPWQVSVIATDSISVSGTPIVQPSNSLDILFVAGTDLKIVGNASQIYEGLMMAHEQFSTTGNPTLNGSVIIEDAQNIDSTVNNNAVGGDINLTYDGSLQAISDKVTVLNWHEVTSHSPS